MTEKTLLFDFSINQQVAENEGHRLMISGIAAGLHHFADKAKVFFKDINQHDEVILGNIKCKIYTRDAISDEDMLIYDEYFLNHPEIDVYILCKIKGGMYDYLGYIPKNIVAETRVVQMIGAAGGDASKKLRRIFADQYKHLSEILPIYQEVVTEKKIITQQKYVPLHLHTEYSIGDGFGKVSYIAEKLAEKGFKGSAITDHGSLSGVWEFQKALLEHNLKPILGVEAYVKLAVSDTTTYHLTLLVKTNKGWENLLKLNSIAVYENYYYKPIMLLDDVFKYSEGLIAMSACSSGFITKLFNNNNKEYALSLMKKFQSIFHDDYYIEVMLYKEERYQKALQEITKFADLNNIKVVFTTDTHYSEYDDKKYHQAIKAISYKKKYAESGFDDDCFYLLQEEDINKKMIGVLEWQKNFIEAWENNTFEVFNKCDFLLACNEKQDTMPQIKYENKTQEEVLKELCLKGLSKYTKYKYENNIKERLDLELNRIFTKGYTNYFLMVADMIKWAKSNGIMVGPGRGSVGGSLVAYCLNVTEVDPIEHDLLFDRFISEIRKDKPDCDIDYQDDRRFEVFDYLKNKYGQNNCAKVITFAQFHGKGIMRDIARIFDIPMKEVEKVNSMIIERSGGDARATLSLTDTFTEFEEAKKFLTKYPEATEIACKLEGHKRHYGVHAAAMIITDKEIASYVPVTKVNGEIVTAFEKQTCEDAGLVKFDILGLSTLTLIQDCVMNIKCKLPAEFNDNEVYKKIFQTGKTLGVFQFNTTGMTKLTTQLQVASFNELYDATTLYRPGCLHSGQTLLYANRKLGKEPVEYLHRTLEPITKLTQGTILYQEQIMLIMHQIGGLSWATSEMARKIITKSKGKDAFNKVRQEFVRNAKTIHNMKEEEAEGLYDVVSTFGSYGFNKSHAVEYSIISYWCAWLKLYYPKYFYKALLKYEQDEAIIQEAIQEAESLGIKINYPDINKSEVRYSIVDGEIYAGLNSIIGIGLKTAEKIIAKRPYSSIQDFKQKTKISDKLFKGLLIADSFRAFNINKKQYYENNFISQEDFSEVELTQLIFQYTTLKPTLHIQQAYDFGHYRFLNVSDIKEQHSNTIQQIRGIVTQVFNKDKLLRHDLANHVFKFEEHMYYLNLNDGTGNIAVQINPGVYENYSNIINVVEKQPIIVLGRISKDSKKIYADVIQIVSGPYKTNDFDIIFNKIKDLNKNINEAVIISAQPQVSKNKKSYYRIALHNLVEGLCFRFDKKLIPGLKVRYSIQQKPFLSLEVL
jgi:DNA polymerase-3 subunit alpha